MLDESTTRYAGQAVPDADRRRSLTLVGFGQLQVDDLSDWDGELSHAGFQSLVKAVERCVGRRARLGAEARPAERQTMTAELEAFKAAQIAGTAGALSELRCEVSGQRVRRVCPRPDRNDGGGASHGFARGGHTGYGGLGCRASDSRGRPGLTGLVVEKAGDCRRGRRLRGRWAGDLQRSEQARSGASGGDARKGAGRAAERAARARGRSEELQRRPIRNDRRQAARVTRAKRRNTTLDAPATTEVEAAARASARERGSRARAAITETASATSAASQGRSAVVRGTAAGATVCDERAEHLRRRSASPQYAGQQPATASARGTSRTGLVCWSGPPAITTQASGVTGRCGARACEPMRTAGATKADSLPTIAPDTGCCGLPIAACSARVSGSRAGW